MATSRSASLPDIPDIKTSAATAFVDIAGQAMAYKKAVRTYRLSVIHRPREYAKVQLSAIQKKWKDLPKPIPAPTGFIDSLLSKAPIFTITSFGEITPRKKFDKLIDAIFHLLNYRRSLFLEGTRDRIEKLVRESGHIDKFKNWDDAIYYFTVYVPLISGRINNMDREITGLEVREYAELFPYLTSFNTGISLCKEMSADLSLHKLTVSDELVALANQIFASIKVMNDKLANYESEHGLHIESSIAYLYDYEKLYDELLANFRKEAFSTAIKKLEESREFQIYLSSKTAEPLKELISNYKKINAENPLLDPRTLEKSHKEITQHLVNFLYEPSKKDTRLLDMLRSLTDNVSANHNYFGYAEIIDKHASPEVKRSLLERIRRPLKALQDRLLGPSMSRDAHPQFNSSTELFLDQLTSWVRYFQSIAIGETPPTDLKIFTPYELASPLRSIFAKPKLFNKSTSSEGDDHATIIEGDKSEDVEDPTTYPGRERSISTVAAIDVTPRKPALIDSAMPPASAPPETPKAKGGAGDAHVFGLGVTPPAYVPAYYMDKGLRH